MLNSVSMDYHEPNLKKYNKGNYNMIIEKYINVYLQRSVFYMRKLLLGPSPMELWTLIFSDILLHVYDNQLYHSTFIITLLPFLPFNFFSQI